jgi:hypothetical protein
MRLPLAEQIAMNPLKFNLTDFELNTVVSPTEVKHVT